MNLKSRTENAIEGFFMEQRINDVITEKQKIIDNQNVSIVEYQESIKVFSESDSEKDKTIASLQAQIIQDPQEVFWDNK